MKIRFKNLTFIGLVLVLLTVFSLQAISIEQEEIVLNYPHDVAPGSWQDRQANMFKEIVENLSGGMIKIEIYPGGELGGGPAIIDGMKIGTHHVTASGSRFWAEVANYYPKAAVMELPYLFPDRIAAERFANSAVGRELLDKLQESGSGIVALGYVVNGWRHIITKQPIYNPKDLEGLKLRVSESKLRVATWRGFGANPSPLAWSEIYSALAQGVFDGAEGTIANFSASHFYEQTDYVTLTGHMFDLQIIGISEVIWNDLPEQAKYLLRKAAELTGIGARIQDSEEEQQALKVLQENGVELIEVDIDEWKEAVQPVWDMYTEEYGEELLKRINKATETPQF